MGQCKSRKSVDIGSIANGKKLKLLKALNPAQKKMEKGKVSRGAATSFGFKGKSPARSSSTNPLPSVAASVTKETIEPIVIPSLPKHGTGKVKAKKETKTANRFGFRPMAPLSNKVSDLQDETKQDKEEPKQPTSNALKLTGRRNSPAETRSRTSSPALQIPVRAEVPHTQSVKYQSDVAKFTLHSSSLPRPQCPVRLSTPDKSAKTAANQQTASSLQHRTTNSSPTASGSNKFGFRSSKSGKADPLRLEIEQLEESPSVTHKYRQISQQKRPNEITFTANRNKTFNLRDLQDNRSGDNLSHHGTPVRTQNQSTPVAMVQPHLTTSQYSASSRLMNESTTSIESYGEEKHKRDLESSEKDSLREDGDACVPDEMWGHGEAMALEEGLSCLDGIDQSPGMNIALRSVLLKIEDSTFACLAAMSASDMLEDEKSPESLASPDLSSSPPSVEPLPPPPLLKDSPDTPMSPTHGSNSCSSDARDRDFLIDDEIADQPGLVFNNPQQNGLFLDMGGSSAPEAMASLSEQVSKVLASLNDSPRPRDRAQSPSLGTLSPCDSLASDDLMVDFDTSQTNNLNELNELDDTVLSSELEMQRSQVMKEWNSILTAHPALSTSLDGSRRVRSRVASRSSVAPTDSPKSHQSSVSSPRKPINTGTISPGDDVSVDSGIRVDRGTYQTMFQEVINIKTMLLKLKRVLNESESMDPFDKKGDGLYYGVTSEAGEGNPHQLADLRRQVVLMQHQLEEKDRVIVQQKELLARLTDAKRSPVESLPTPTTKSNAATQTDKIRPLSSSPILFHTSNEDSPHSLVSCMTEKLKNGRR